MKEIAEYNIAVKTESSGIFFTDEEVYVISLLCGWTLSTPSTDDYIRHRKENARLIMMRLEQVYGEGYHYTLMQRTGRIK